MAKQAVLNGYHLALMMFNSLTKDDGTVINVTLALMMLILYCSVLDYGSYLT